MKKKQKKYPVYSATTSKMLGEASLPHSLEIALDVAAKPLSVATSKEDDCLSYKELFGDIEEIHFDTKEEKIWVRQTRKKS